VTRQLHTRDEAELDVIDAVVWYENQRIGLGSEFLTELDSAMSRMADKPLSFPKIKDYIRRVLLHRFPYSVYFW
jgi:toxin ParE1/3/4